MAVNLDFWGAKITWVSYDNNVSWSPGTAKENYTFAYGRNGASPPSHLPDGEEFDLSAAPWGIGGDSILCKLSYLLPLADESVEVRPVDPEQYGKPHPLILTGGRQCTVPGTVLNYTLGQQDGQIPLYSWYIPDFKPNYNAFSDYSWWTQNILVNFDYSKIILVPYIITTQGDSYTASSIRDENSYMYWTVDQILTRWSEIDGKKAIKGLYLAVYNGNPGSRTGQGAKFLFNIPQKYPAVEIVDQQWGTNVKPVVDTDTLINNGWTPSSMWADSDNKGKMISSPYSIRYYSDLDTWQKSLQWWSWHGNPVSFMDDDWNVYQEDPAVQGDKVIRPIFNYDGKTAQQVVDYFLKQVALLGFPFALDPADKQGIIGDNNSISLPVFDSNGITTGEYRTGSDCRDLKNFLWRDDVWERNEYDPYKPITDDESDRGDLTNRVPIRDAEGGTTRYVCSKSTLATLLGFLNGTYLPDDPTLIADFKGTNPQNYIVSVQRYPFTLPTTGTPNIYIGSVNTNITAKYLLDTPTSIYVIYDFGNIKIQNYYYDFRDYISKITLFMPFIGSVEIDPKLYMGHSVGLRYILDYSTGSVAAEIKRDGFTMETKTSTISVTIPFFAADMATYQATLASLEYAIDQSKIKQITGIASTAFSAGAAIATGGASSAVGALGLGGGLIGGVSGMTSGLIQQQSLQYQLDHTIPQTGTISVAAPANAFFMDDRARIVITRPKMLPGFDGAEYSHTVGNACAIAGKLNSFTGYTVAGAATLDGITATDGSGTAPTRTELDMIKQLLQAGIFV